MSISEFNDHDFSMSHWSKIQWFFHDFFIFTNFKNFSWNSMIFPWSWNRSEFQWFFKSCGNPVIDAEAILSVFSKLILRIDMLSISSELRQQAITSTNFECDLCRHISFPDHNELNNIFEHFRANFWHLIYQRFYTSITLQNSIKLTHWPLGNWNVL